MPYLIDTCCEVLRWAVRRENDRRLEADGVADREIDRGHSFVSLAVGGCIPVAATPARRGATIAFASSMRNQRGMGVFALIVRGKNYTSRLTPLTPFAVTRCTRNATAMHSLLDRL